MSPDLQVVAAMAARQSQNRQPFDHSKGSFLRKTTSWADGREMELFVADSKYRAQVPCGSDSEVGSV